MNRPTDLLDASGRPEPTRVLAAVAVSLVVAETLTIAVRAQLPPLSPVERIALEALVPALLVGPVLYRYLLVPLSESVVERESHRRRLQQYEDLVTNLPIGVFRTTPGSEGQFLEVNPAMISMFEAESKDALLERSVSDFYRDPENHASVSEKLLAEGIITDEVLALQTFSERPLWGSVSAIGKENADGEIYFDGIVLDVTDRIDTKAALERSEQQYATLVEESNNGIVIIQDGKFAFANARMADILGVDADDLMGESFVEFLAPEYREMVAERYERRMAGEQPSKRYEAAVVRADGGQVPIEINGSRIEYEGRPADMAIISDITERRAHEETLRALQESARELMRADSRTEIATLTIDTGTELLDHDAAGIWFLDPDAGQIELAASKEGWPGDDPPVVDVDGELCQCLQAGEPLVVDDPELQGTEWLDERVQSMLALSLGEFGLLTIGSFERGAFDESAIDLATILSANAEAALDRVDHEERLRDQGKALAQRNDQLEFLHSLLRHDLLNGMQVITARVDYLDGRVEGDNQEYVETIQHWCSDMVSLVEKVRAALEVLTGREQPELDVTDLAETLEPILDRVSQTYPSVAVHTDIPGDCAVLADEMLTEVLGNVVTNAVEHNRGGDLTLSVSADRDGDTVTLRVADDGAGIDDDRKESIFQRGASDQKGSGGSGFGLYFVDTMVSNYGGHVSVEDNDPTGAVFVIELPAADAELNSPATDP